MESVVEQPPASPEDWVEWFLDRLQREPWALGGVVVMGLFVLTILSLVIFAVLYGCCCSRKEEKQNKKQKQRADGVI